MNTDQPPVLDDKTPKTGQQEGVTRKRAARAVIDRCLSKDLAARFASAVELEQALAGCGAAAEWSRAKVEAWWAETATTRWADHGAS